MGMENRLVFSALTEYIRSMYQKIASQAVSLKSFHALIMILILLLMFLLSLTWISLLHYAHNPMNYFLDVQRKIKNTLKLSTRFIEILSDGPNVWQDENLLSLGFHKGTGSHMQTGLELCMRKRWYIFSSQPKWFQGRVSFKIDSESTGKMFWFLKDLCKHFFNGKQNFWSKIFLWKSG